MSRAPAFRSVALLLSVVLLLSAVPLFGAVIGFHRPRKKVHPARAQGVDAPVEVTMESPEQLLGERLFLDYRFSQYFATHSSGDVNKPLAQGDPLVDTVRTRTSAIRGPFRGQAVNCRSCHFVDELNGTQGGGARTYSDFLPRSPLPVRNDGQTTTPRNSMNMVDSFIEKPGRGFLHADGEFIRPESLVKDTLTGRNMGWLPTERREAIAQIAKVIREDNTKALDSGGPYAVLLRSGADVDSAYRLPEQYRFDAAHATDEQIVDQVAILISAYLRTLTFARGPDGAHIGSAYDLFLLRNHLPTAPEKGETDGQYTVRLARALDDLHDPKWVVPTDGMFLYHNQFWRFGEQELKGLKVFLRTADATKVQGVRKAGLSGRPPVLAVAVLGQIILILCLRPRLSRAANLSIVGFATVLTIGLAVGSTSLRAETPEPPSHVGNCATCHTPPDFTDGLFHNTGASQEEYDSVHGVGSFAKLEVPDLKTRSAHRALYLPATPGTPNGSNIFRSPATGDRPEATDLGLWNVFANADYPEPQARLLKIFCKSDSPCEPSVVLPQTLARFRTPGLRDLADSDPFLHTGRKKTIAEVLQFYREMSNAARKGQVRNGDEALRGISIDEQDSAALAAFLRSLTEDYD